MIRVDNKHVLVNNNYYICNKKRKFVKVDGKKIILKGFENFEFFYFNLGGKIIICEAFTGSRVSFDISGNLINVLRATIDEMNDIGINRLKKVFSLMSKVTKLSPRYRYICTPIKK